MTPGTRFILRNKIIIAATFFRVYITEEKTSVNKKIIAAPNTDPAGLVDAGSTFVHQVVQAVVKGDMKADGVLTASDVVLLLNCVFLGIGNCNNGLADVNCDGVLTAADVVILMNAVFLGTPLPC